MQYPPFNPEHTPTPHSPIGASSFSRWSNCPGSVPLSKQVGDARTSQWAAEGTVAHAIVEYFLTHRLPFSWHLLGLVVTESGYEVEITEEMMDAVETCVNYVYETAAEYGVPPEFIQSEQRVTLETISNDCFGTCDVVICKPYQRIHVIDYKHGAGIPVDITNNGQLLYYAYGALLAMPHEAQREISEIAITIVQPRAQHHEGPIRTQVLTRDQLDIFVGQLKAAVNRINAGNVDIVPGAWCRFCAAKLSCPGIRTEMTSRAQSDFTKMNAPQPPAPQALTPEQIAAVLTHAPMIKDWLKAVQDHAVEVASTTRIPGYKLVRTLSNREWVDMDAATKLFYPMLGDQIFEPYKLKSPAKMEKLKSDLSKSELKKMVDKQTQRKETGVTITDVSDKRQDIAQSAKAAFDLINL